MKPANIEGTPNQSCSCTSCLYKSESDHPSLRRLIAQGSKIDKLYYGKYIPLRERKLLNKLVRTRAVYDDIRNQLLSGSDISVAQVDLNPKNKAPVAKPDKRAQKGGDIPALVDLVDKGNVPHPKDLSECCSCCICDSKLNAYGELSEIHAHKHKRRAGARMSSKSSIISRHMERDEPRKGKAVHFKTKHIRSDPCTCTYKLGEIIKRHSKSMVKKLRQDRPEPVLEPLVGAPEQNRPKKKKTVRKAMDKVKQSKTRLVKGMQEGTRKSATKIEETKTKVKENIEAAAKKSLEIIQETKHKLQEKKESRRQRQEELVMQIPEESTEERTFKIRKDSLTKFREKLRRKRELQDWECDYECLMKECAPEECFRIITRRRLGRMKSKGVRESSSAERRNRKRNEKSKASDVSIQAQKTKKLLEYNKKKQSKMQTEKKKKLHTSCLCIEIKKKDLKNRGTLPEKKDGELKSKTNLPRKHSKSPVRIVPTEPMTQADTTEPTSGIRVEHPLMTKHKEEKLKKPQIRDRPGAVRVGSTISVNIEFYKEINGSSEVKTRKDLSSLMQERQHKLKTKDRHGASKNVRRRNKGSETSVILSGRNIQTAAHPLKRCFCTLKLKPRKTKTTINVDKVKNVKCLCPVFVKESVTESIQTKNMRMPIYSLEPYECEPGVCIPDECDPKECEKRIRTRNRELRTVSLNTKTQMKSTSSITTRSASSSAPKGLQVQPVKKQKSHPHREAVAPTVKSSSSHKQAVRIGSTFSFQIEFTKGGTNVTPNVSEYKKVAKHRKDRSVPVAKQYVKRKYSQISSSTKNKFSYQKHKLKRCFCTLKINKAEKKKTRIISTSHGTVTSGQLTNIPEPQPGLKTVSSATKRRKKNKIKMKSRLLPYECEPGICVPGECDPYACLELLKVREFQTKSRTSNTDYNRQTKSTSSFAPKLMKHSRTKQVQSTLVAYKGKTPRSRITKKMPLSRPVSLPSPKQAVKIGSTFSFNIEFFKDSPVKDVPIVNYRSSPKNVVRKERQATPKTRGSQGSFETQRKSVFMQAERKQKSVPISTGMKRCFCTLKLKEPDKSSMKTVTTVGTKTPKFRNKEPKYQTVATKKRIKKYQNNLEYLEYECEPYVCIPGECDPYECLERIQNRHKTRNSREVGVLVEPSKMISTSSSVQNFGNSKKHAFAQSKSVKKRRNKMKEKHATAEQIPMISKVYADKQSRQSVRLGSSFSFDIEFHKDRKSDENQIIQIPHGKRDVQDSRLYKNRGDQSLRAAMLQHKSQANLIKKTHKGTGVAPILKRCFCTLQLQNKKHHPNTPQVYTVSRLSVTKPQFMQKKIESNRPTTTFIKKNDSYNLRKISTTNAIYSSGIMTSSIFSYSTMDTKLVQPYTKSISGPISQTIFGVNYNLKYHNFVKPPKTARSLCIKNPSSIRHLEKYSDVNVKKYKKCYASSSKRHTNEISAYLSRQFCAMNIQVANKYRSPNKHKLEPDECEPGFCVPYECDPLVCKERIMKRLMRGASKSSGTESRKHSASSTTANAQYHSKELQSNATGQPARKVRKQPPARVSHEKEYSGGQRQAVRVGSNFSFNIEFSKGTRVSEPVKKVRYPSTTIKHKMTHEKMRHKGTKGHLRSGTDRESQSSVQMAHRGSSATPLLKRCFCTLKLDKKSNQEKVISPTEDKGVTFNNDNVIVQTADSTQNTERQKIRKLKHKLEPYECEPGVCIPGECNPYECLELIKKRHKDFGTDSMKYGRMSTSSMTPSQKKRMKSEKQQRVPKQKHTVPSVGSVIPLRQVVRIGSTFSFNVEFFKDNPDLQRKISVTSRNIKHKPHREKKIPRQTRDLKERFSQDDKSLRHRDSQSDSTQHMKSTMTGSLIKRCFCTAKLHKQKKLPSKKETTVNKTVNVNVEQQTKTSPSLLQRCICAMKSLTTTKPKSGTSSQTKQQSVPKSHSPPLQELLPYECEPGVCVPGECDPYVCEKLIRQRNAKVRTKVTSTGRLRTKSQSSGIQSYGSGRGKETQMNIDTSSKIVKPTSSGDFDKRKQVQYSSSPGRQAVRIGSSFNFNIEFYKDNQTLDTSKNKSSVEYRPKRRRESHSTKRNGLKSKSRGSLGRKKHGQSRESQVQETKTKDQASGVGQLLQRCFCTLSLRKPKVPQKHSDTSKQSKRTAVVREPNTKSVKCSINKAIPYKLEPYECEPNTCIPGQCDPYECEKRIQRRLRQEHGTSTIHSKTKSATSMASSTRKLKNTKVQSRSKKTPRHRIDRDHTRVTKFSKPDTPSRQAVRIGSTFSFDIEFFKDSGHDSSIKHVTELKKQYKDVEDYDHKNKRRSTVSCATKSCQARKRMREVDSQVLAKKMRSTMTGVTPFLKRCFCTLKLQQKQHAAELITTNKIHNKIATDTKSTYTSKKLYQPPATAHLAHLDPYECEPGVCVPGQCDPYECEKRIKMRNIGRRSVSSNTEKYKDSSKLVWATTEHKGTKLQAKTIPRVRKSPKSTISKPPRSYVQQSDLTPSYSPHRQAVRIGSNFSFDIEFFKDNALTGVTREVVRSEKVERHEYRPKASTKSMGAGNKGISFYHRKSQAHGPTTETKGSGVGPFLKRCFCTLKLQKQGKQQQRNVQQKVKLQSDKQPSAKIQANYKPKPSSFDASTKTKKNRHVLEPYECEPNVCVPGFCDPHECLLRIQRRQMKESGISTDRPSMISGYSSTSKKIIKDKSLKTKHFKERRAEKDISFDKEPRKIFPSESPNRQAVRIGSSFKFDIEFYKQGSTPDNHSHGDGQDYKDSFSKNQPKQRSRRLESRGFQRESLSRCQGVQMKGAEKQSTGSGMVPILKRCFCTLALQNTSKQPAFQKPITPKAEIRAKDANTQSKSSLTKTKSLPYALDPYECEPNVCVPGECDPYVCYERIKRRNARYKSKGLGTDIRQHSQASSMTSRHGKHTRRTQPVLLGKRRRQHSSSSMNKPMVVEQPRFKLLSDIANRNVVKIGSNISFNIEFYKEIAPPGNFIYTDERRKTADSQSRRDTKSINTYKCPNYRNCQSQAKTLQTQNKGSLVTNTLKRCFCTAQFHKTNISKTENRKCIECKPKSMFGPQQYQVYYHKASFKKKSADKCICTACEDDLCNRTKSTSTKASFRNKLKRRSNPQNKNKTTNDMETILPYKANKFNKKVSKTLIGNKRKKSKRNKSCASDECIDLPISKVDNKSVPKNRRLKTKKSTKNINKKLKTPILTENDLTESNNLNNKSFLCRCKEFFTRQKGTDAPTTAHCPDNCPTGNKIAKEPEFVKFESLKKSKSEGRRIKQIQNEAKKSKSLKTNKCLENNCYYDNDDYKYTKLKTDGKKRNKKASIVGKSNKTGILSEENKKNICPHCGDHNPDTGNKLNKSNKKQVKFSNPHSPNLTGKIGCEDRCKSKGQNKQTVGKNAVEMEETEVKSKTKSKSARKHKKSNDIEDFCSYCQEVASVDDKETISVKNKKTKSKSKGKEKTRLEGVDNPCARGVCGKTGARLTIAAKGGLTGAGGKVDIDAAKKIKGQVMKKKLTEEEICACYSSICECAKAIQKEKEETRRKELELEHQKRSLKKKVRKQQEAAKSSKHKHKDYLKKQSRYLHEDEIRRRKRAKQNAYLSKRLKSVKASDAYLAVDSVLDIAKLSCTVLGDAARSTCRFLTDPKYTLGTLKRAVKEPQTVVKAVVEDTGFIATLKRVFMRVNAMQGYKSLKAKLEENAVTGYLMKMAEQDPAKRMAKIKVPKKRENLDDFECSLYMNSLRKKRCLAVYYLCPWFYPHFITLLNLVGQVTDLLLFLVAVFVWSPCILCMELCRAFVCCFLCTG